MTFTKQNILAAALVFAMAASGRAMGQVTPSTTWEQPPPVQASPSPSAPLTPQTLPPGTHDPFPLTSQPLFDFKDSDIKFNLTSLMNVLRDSRHEGWVLAAYPDPRTSQPLIGAGFSLDLLTREHAQPDPLNPHPFLEPSSAELWQAAGFDPARLDDLLKVFYERRREWSKRTWRRQLFSLPA